MKRRKFIQTTAAISSGVTLGAFSNCKGGNTKQTTGKSRVVVGRSPGVVNDKLKIDNAKVPKLLDAAMKHYFQQDSVEACWQVLFSPQDVVGIKVNCLAGRGLSTNPVVVDAIIAGLKLAGVKEKNIIVWDRLNNDLRRGGYKIQTRNSGVRYFGNDSAGYSADLVCYGQVGSLVSKVVTEYCSALINVPILKDHGIVGVSVAMKNYFGAIHNPNKYHDNIGDPYVADVNMFPDIRRKTRLTICDALVAQYEGGPPYMPHWAWPFGGIIIGQDMVAIDQVGWDIIEAERKKHSLPTLEKAGRKPTYIATAASAEYSLGTNDPAKIDLLQFEI